jgi:hypothetical protein
MLPEVRGVCLPDATVAPAVAGATVHFLGAPTGIRPIRSPASTNQFDGALA